MRPLRRLRPHSGRTAAFLRVTGVGQRAFLATGEMGPHRLALHLVLSATTAAVSHGQVPRPHHPPPRQRPIQVRAM